MINLAPIPVTPISTTDNAADGPESAETEPQIEETAEAPEPPPPPPEPEPEVLPDLPPPPPEQKREEIKPKPETPKKVREKVKPKKAERPPQVASKLGGGPVSNVQTGETSAAPTTGGKGASASMIDNWIAKMRSRILRAKRFPKEARGEDYGAATISVTFAPDGSVTAARITMSSGSPILDREALATVYRAAPYPKLPGGQPMTQKIALNFIKK
jgi:protein TonB